MPSETETILEVDGLSKLYSRVPSSTRKRLAQDFRRALLWAPPKVPSNLRKGEFWSLDNINFNLKRGEAIGVIGLNGAGKTTLLRVLSGQLLPDKGEVRISGTTAAMIDLTAGFSSSASGMQNIFLRGAMLGRSRLEMNERLQEIIDFSELGDAIAAPFATYSSGMKMRLAFSIMIASSPDIVFIDEILSVGDFRFRQKCLAKIRELREKSAFVLVSHSMADISRFCNKAIMLQNGKIVCAGDPDEVIQVYLDHKSITKTSSKLVNVEPKSKPIKVPEIESADSVDFVVPPVNLAVYSPEPYRDSEAINNINLLVNNADESDLKLELKSPLSFEVELDILRPCRHLIFGFSILTDQGEGVSGVSSDGQGIWLKVVESQKVKVNVKIPYLFCNPGKYSIFFNARDGVELLLRTHLFNFEVVTPSFNTFGVVTPKHSWNLEIGEV